MNPLCGQRVIVELMCNALKVRSKSCTPSRIRAAPEHFLLPEIHPATLSESTIATNPLPEAEAGIPGTFHVSEMTLRAASSLRACFSADCGRCAISSMVLNSARAANPYLEQTARTKSSCPASPFSSQQMHLSNEGHNVPRRRPRSHAVVLWMLSVGTVDGIVALSEPFRALYLVKPLPVPISEQPLQIGRATVKPGLRQCPRNPSVLSLEKLDMHMLEPPLIA